jgi:hypothetical protein
MNFSLRRLDPHNDEDVDLLRQAFVWDTEDVPAWYSNAEQIFGGDSWEQYLERARREEQIDLAVIEDSNFCGLITDVLVAPRTFEVFIRGPRRSNAELLTLAAFAMAKNMFDDGVAEAFTSWVCSRHRGALRLNKDCGMVEDGVTMLKGVSHGRPLEWKRLILTRQRMAELIDG